MRRDHGPLELRLERLPAEAWDLPAPPPPALPPESPRSVRWRLVAAVPAVGLALPRGRTRHAR